MRLHLFVTATDINIRVKKLYNGIQFKVTTLSLFLLLLTFAANAQITIGGDSIKLDYSNPTEYEIAAITVDGVQYYDKGIIVMLSGLSIGDKIDVPGEKLSIAIENLWKQGLFGDIEIIADKIEGKKIFLRLKLEERPRLSRFAFKGISRSEADKLRDKIKLIRDKVVNDELIVSTTNLVKDYYRDKGYYDAQVSITQEPDSNLVNKVLLTINVKQNKKIKINKINIIGNSLVADGKLRRSMKDTKERKWYSLFTTSKFIEENYKVDKQSIIAVYNENGFRDAAIIHDSVYRYDSKSLNIDIVVEEGRKYYFRDITWVGNTKYNSDTLNRVLGIKRGDVYNQSTLEGSLFSSPNGTDVSSLYMDMGYLFFSVTPVEVSVSGDSIDFEMRVYEGKPAIINKITIVGNTKTNDHVILREIRTKPGQLFRRSDIILTQRELAQLGYFNPEALQVNPKPDPINGTVDIEYVVEEKPSDQIELSGGWGAGRLVGTLGVTFNNFSARNMFKKGMWRPLPAGDGQRLSIRGQTNGIFFQSYNFSFTEPWLGGRKPNSLTFSIFHTAQSNGFAKSDSNRVALRVTGGTIGLGTRWKRPDNYFNAFYSLNLQNYDNDRFISSLATNSFSATLGITISRNSIDQPIYPREGSNISFSLQATPPWSLRVNKDGIGFRQYAADDLNKYKLIEYHKWKFDVTWYHSLVGKLVLCARAHVGYLGFYNSSIGTSLFERFQVGGSGLSNFNLVGTEIIALRGYPDGSLSPGNNQGSAMYNRYILEMRYPVSLNPQATVFGLAFLEGGNTWDGIREFNPFTIKRAAGVGVRVFLPMFGMLGLDYGYGFDKIERLGSNQQRGNIHFIIGQQF
jgi:outer membrane protein insertion porin family